MKNKDQENSPVKTGLEMAVIGMAGRFPGARNIDEFWDNLKNGVESISFLTPQELDEAGVGSQLLENPNYVNSKGGVIEDKELFDASFFGYTPREAEVMDPQFRLFHECAWEALENAGYNPFSYNGKIGVYAGAAFNLDWFALTLLSGKQHELGAYAAAQLTDKDFLTTKLSYSLNLKGPSIVVQTTCSTSLVAIHLACRSLLMGECDIALAGGVAVSTMEGRGYVFQEGMINSPDGHCRAFDARANGTIGGNGVGIVVLKRLSGALSEGDLIHAVVKGSAVNNDGRRKIGYSAPSVDGQAELIKAVRHIAKVEAESIGYVETHGTGTTLGDPIEVQALELGFNTRKKHFCAIGSVKTNIGHLNTAAGVAGFIKSVLALKHRLIPPSLHFENPSPNIDFTNSPFYVNTVLSQWKSNGFPLRAAVSSFGIGGTNAHVILEEAPPITASSAGRPFHLLVLSAQNETVLDRSVENLAEYFKKNSDINPADAAYTLQMGRRALPCRGMLVCQDTREAVDILSSRGTGSSGPLNTNFCTEDERSVVFLFSGQGAQYVDMGRELYRTEPFFREQADRCFEILSPLTPFDLKDVLFPRGPDRSDDADYLSPEFDINQTALTQPALFVLEYSLARLLMEWGLEPAAMMGHSIGEYAAACLAGVFSLEDALKLVVLRGKLMQQMPAGSMVTVPLPENEIEPLLNEKLSLAAVNGPSRCVVSGEHGAVDALTETLRQKGYDVKRLHTSHAFHSEMMAPIMEPFEEAVRQVTLNTPEKPYISNVTGSWITEKEALDPHHWSVHLRNPVRFSDGLEVLLKEADAVFVEIGPGKTLSTLVRQHPGKKPAHRALNLLKHPKEEMSDVYHLLRALGQLWLYGVEIDWSRFYSKEKRHRIALPTYPFERQRYWIEGDPFSMGGQMVGPKKPVKRPDISDWFYVPSWKRSILTSRCSGPVPPQSCWLVFIHERSRLGKLLVERLESTAGEPVVVTPGMEFKRENPRLYRLNPGESSHYEALFSELQDSGRMPHTIAHLWSVVEENEVEPGESLERLESAHNLGFHSLTHIAQAIGNRVVTHKVRLKVITDNLQEVNEEPVVCPERATLLGPVKIIPREYDSIDCNCIDIRPPEPGSPPRKYEKLLEQLVKELGNESTDVVVAYRGGYRWVQTFEPLPVPDESSPLLKEKGVYLVTGGLGGIGLVLAEYLAEALRAKLVLTGRGALPAREEWESRLTGNRREDRVSQRIRKVLELEKAGAEVLVFSADAADYQQMKAVISQTKSHFGTVNGVIHSAGIPGGGIIQVREREISDRILAPKVRGTLVLDRIMREEGLEPDFFFLCSSLNSVLAPFGSVAYSAANLFLDTFARYKTSKDGVFTASVNWDGWQEVGMAVEALKKAAEKDGNAPEPEAVLKDAILPIEGVEVFKRILGEKNNLSQVVVSTTDLNTRMEQHGMTEAREAPSPGEAETPVPPKPSYRRPRLSTGYAAPRSELERKLADIWQRFYGFEEIGIYDDFFELGGDSLLGMKFVNQYKVLLGEMVQISVIFNAPTIAALADFFTQSYPEAAARLTGVTAPAQQEPEPGTVSKYTAIEPAEKREYYVLSSAQRRLYFLQQMEANNVGYNISHTLLLEGTPDVDKFQSTFRQLTQRHESLRTSFEMIQGELVQRVHSGVPFTIENCEIDETEVMEKVKAMVTLFDLKKAPLFNVKLVKIGNERYLLITEIHHIVSDGASMPVLIRDFTALYSGHPLPLLRVHYKDYSQWRNSESEREVVKKQEKYWLDMFSGEISVLNLPTDYERPPVQRFDGNAVDFEIGAEGTAGLKRFARQQGATLYMVLLAVYTIFLSKTSGQEDVIVGSPSAGRNHPDLEQIAGMFINTLVLRNFPAPGKTFRDYLEEIKVRTLEVFENQEYPFESLVNRVKVERDPSRNPLFDVMFSFHNEMQAGGAEDKTVTEKALESSLKMLPYRFEDDTSKFDLTLSGIEVIDRLTLTFEYSTALFKEETVQRFISYFKRVVDSVLLDSDGGRLISTVDILPQEEKIRLLVEFNHTSVILSPLENKTVHELFEERVRHTPGHTVLVEGDRHLSYRALDAKAGLYANTLKRKGLQPQSVVGIMLERSIEMIAAILGILKAGAVYLPIDPFSPNERIEYMLNDCNVNVLIIPGFMRHQIRRFSFEGETVEAEEAAAVYEEKMESREPGHKVTSRQPAYIIYTSGSTGKPKGALIGHRNVVRLVKNPNYIDLKEGRLLMTGTLVFDITTFEIWAPLLNGLQLYLTPEDIVLDLEKLKGSVLRNRISILHLIPQLFNQAVDRCIELFGGLEYFLVGGDLVRPGYVNRLRSKYENLKILHMYGPTENTTFSTFFPVEEDYEKTIPIGRPIGHSSVYILDGGCRLQPIGVVGELCVGGAGTAVGYLNSGELTREKFVPNPFVAGERIYKTGDLARWLPSGPAARGAYVIEFLGRKDHQVKIRGIRIELGEIESQLMKRDEIKEAVVLAMNNRDEDKYLAAYIIAEETVDKALLREYLADKLPGYMVPSYFVIMEKFPLTSNGKVDRKKLPDPKKEMDVGTTYEPPANDIEENILHIWADVLGLETGKIGMEDNFFELGGNSISILNAIHKISESFDVRVSMSEFILNPTIRRLADSIYEDTLFSRLQCVVCLNRRRTDRKSIFIVHQGEGMVYPYKKFANLLENHFNVYGIQAKGVMHDTTLPRNPKELLADYIREIKAVQPEGPYIIGGYCLGTLIAYDLVRILEDLGDPVEWLIMFNQPPLFSKYYVKYLEIKALLWKPKSLKDEIFDATPEPPPAAKGKEKIDDTSALDEEKKLILAKNLDKVGNKIKPWRIIRSKVLVFKAQDFQNIMLTRENWTKMTKGDVKFVEVPGNHNTIFTIPFVNSLAKTLRQLK